MKNLADGRIGENVQTTSYERNEIGAIQTAPPQRWFGPDMPDRSNEIILAYMNGGDEREVEALAGPIDALYSSGNRIDEKGMSVEKRLVLLWDRILNAAKRSGSAERLVSLIRALKDRPNPRLPDHLTDDEIRDLKESHVCSNGKLWSELCYLESSARECWNEDPSNERKLTLPEIQAWTNMIAFTARLTQEDLFDFSFHARWAAKDALNPDIVDRRPHAVAMAVWIIIAGEKLWQHQFDKTILEHHKINRDTWIELKSLLKNIAQTENNSSIRAPVQDALLILSNLLAPLPDMPSASSITPSPLHHRRLFPR